MYSGDCISTAMLKREICSLSLPEEIDAVHSPYARELIWPGRSVVLAKFTVLPNRYPLRRRHHSPNICLTPFEAAEQTFKASLVNFQCCLSLFETNTFFSLQYDSLRFHGECLPKLSSPTFLVRPAVDLSRHISPNIRF